MLLKYPARFMRMMVALRNLLIAVTAFSFSIKNASASGVTGTVVDSGGAAIGKAHIVIRADSSGRREAVKNPDLILETDEKGHFSANLPPGFYDVCAMADAFTPSCQKILMGTVPSSPTIRLRADPQVMKRLGDVF